METAAKIALGVAALGATWFALAGSSGAATLPAKPDGASQGDLDGCAAGKADALGGSPQALNPTDAAGVSKVAATTTDPAAYVLAYGKGYDRCYAANKKSVGGPPPTGKKGGGPPPGATGPDKAKASSAWGRGCQDGSNAGYAAGYAGNPTPGPSAVAAGASGNAAAYRAGFSQNVTGGYAAGSGAKGLPGYGPGSSSATTLLTEAMAGCLTYFEGWYVGWVASGAKVSGVRTSGGCGCKKCDEAVSTGCTAEVGVFGLMRLRAAPRTTRRSVVATAATARDGRDRRRTAGQKSIDWPSAENRDFVYSP